MMTRIAVNLPQINLNFVSQPREPELTLYIHFDDRWQEIRTKAGQVAMEYDDGLVFKLSRTTTRTLVRECFNIDNDTALLIKYDFPNISDGSEIQSDYSEEEYKEFPEQLVFYREKDSQ